MRAVCGLLFICSSGLLCAASHPASDWVPARWPWSDPKSLELLSDSPVNCLILKSYTDDFVSTASARGILTLVLVRPGGDAVQTVRDAVKRKVTGIVLEGEFAEPGPLREAAAGLPVVEFLPRSRMPLGSPAPILATNQGVWPGVAPNQDTKSAGPTSSVWINTNTGFIRAVRAWGNAAVWIANGPPADTLVTAAQYQHAVADAAMSGARWVLSLDDDYAARLAKRETGAMEGWRQINQLLSYFEKHPEWRQMRPAGRLAVVQDPAKGGLLSGGILDMIAVKHTPVKPVPRQQLTPDALKGATMAVNVDSEALSDEQREVLRNFTRSGGTLLSAPPGWKDQTPGAERITLDKAELERLNDIWRDVNSMVGRRNLGVRLFNVATMLSNVLTSADGSTEIVHLVNYSDYPVEDVALHFLGDYTRATLIAPDGAETKLAIYPAEESRGVDVVRIGICATIKLER